jgi:NADH dehydrogenase
MAALSPADIALPIRGILHRYANINVLLAEISTLDLINRRVLTSVKNLDYDYLILALGANHSYFGHNEWEELAPGLKSLEEATEIRRRVLTAFEQAEHEENPEIQREWLTFVVVGGGPTGVELAGALGEMSRYTLARDFRRINPERTRVFLLEGGPRILPTFAAELSGKAARGLEKLGVTVWTNSIVTQMRTGELTIGSERIRARTILWAAGVQPSPLNATLGISMGPAGRLIVENNLSLPGHPEVLAIGDQANFGHGLEKPLPGTATFAIQQGRHAAHNIKRLAQGKSSIPYRPVDKGMMATIGRAFAVMEIRKIQSGGFFAWLVWLLVHIFYLIGFRNRVVVLFQWAWSYVTFRRGSRLITSRDWRNPALNSASSTGRKTGPSIVRKNALKKKKLRK